MDVTSQVAPADNAWGGRACILSEGFLQWPPTPGAQLRCPLPGPPLSPHADLRPDLTQNQALRLGQG